MNHFTVFDAELYCQISNINPDNIKYLYLCNNVLIDINRVSIFKNLKKLDLDSNKIEDLSPLKNLINLIELNLSCNIKLKNIVCLQDLINLETIKIYFIPVKDLSHLGNLTNLKFLDIDNLNLTDEKDASQYIKKSS